MFKEINEKINKKIRNIYSNSLNKELNLEYSYNPDSLVLIEKDFIIFKEDNYQKTVFNNLIISNLDHLTIFFKWVLDYIQKSKNYFVLIKINKNLIEKYQDETLAINFSYTINNEDYIFTLSKDKQLKLLYELSFNDSSEYIDYYFEEKVKLLEEKVFSENDFFISALYLKPQQLLFHGKRIDSKILIGACTHPKYTRLGLMSSLIKKTLRECYYQNTPIITLNPFDPKFYNQYNFISYSFYSLTESTKGRDYKFRKATFKDINFLLQAYEEYSSKFNIYTIRDEQYFFSILKEKSADDDEITIISKDDKDLGYYIKVGDIIEEYCLDGEAYVTEKKEYIESVANYQNNTLNMARIINPLLFLSKYPFELKRFNAKFKIVDEIILENNLAINLDIDDEVTISLADEYDFEITIDELTTLLLVGNIYNNPHPFYQLFKFSKNLTWEKY